MVATVWMAKFYDDCPKTEEAKANAKLIAAAPETTNELRECIITLKILRNQIAKELYDGKDVLKCVPYIMNLHLLDPWMVGRPVDL